ncbi:EAL domain-containing protein [Pseudoalteromonas haloplanktis]|uniref:EAL domain-containing protein n=1 Tax=Pseudoalteromonas haloplanktis TaxID=228 RepID=A0ABU1BA35_PSEHA|nr:EAL domain-containing protein [Pseudoalteromonas haloplanktis]MDQ9091303.1 EAL domain-containing protein [Pseudoalteromonas haloplanktis]
MNKNLAVLLVEEHLFQRRSIELLLRSIKINIVVASDGEEALLEMKNKKFDAIICDLAMPNMNGLSLIKNLAENHYKGGIVIASSHTQSIIKAVRITIEKFNLNLLGTIEKPIRKEVILPMLNSLRVSKVPPKSFIDIVKITDEQVLAGISKQEFIVYFQPIVGIETGQWLGVEALIRWEHPQYGLLSPSDFKSYLHAEAYSGVFCNYVLEYAVKELQDHIPEHSEIYLSINLSGIDFKECVITSLIKKINQYSEYRKVVIEFSDTINYEDQQPVLESMSTLSLSNIEITLDRFGTGCLSFHFLNSFPATALKLEGSFVRGLSENSSCSTIVDITAILAKRLDLKLFAEGVETLQQWNRLAVLGYVACQGYFISAPLHVSKLKTWANKWKVRYAKL